MKRAKISYIPLDGSGALHLDFQPGPFGDAVEPVEGDGVGFFTHSGDLQGVTFDDVEEKRDEQVLIFADYRIEISIKNGKISYKVATPSPPKQARRSSKKKKSA